MKDARESAEGARNIVWQVPEPLVVTFGDISSRVYDHPSGGPAVAVAIEAGAKEGADAFP